VTRRIALSAEADRDIDAIWTFTVEKWSVSQAEAYPQGLDQLFKLLAEHPHIARDRPEIGPGARIHPYRSYMILFSETPDSLFVSRVIPARSN
jgi:toxin ParE1/3/4